MTAIAIATGIIGVYIVLALIASNINEAISALISQRGNQLYQGIQSLVGETTKLAGAVSAQSDATSKQTLVDAIYKNPLITSLSGAPNITDKVFRRDPRPSYMPARTFTLSLVNEIRQNQVTGPNGAPLSPPDLLATPDALFQDIVARIGGLPDGHLKDTLLSVLQDVDQSYDGFLKGVDSLFEACMQRVAGWYKRWSSVIVAIISLALVALLNSDTLAMIQQLSRNTAELQVITNSAGQLKPGESLDTLLGMLPALNLGWSGGVQIDWSKVLGLAITWFAVMLGAPFWFDILKRLVPVRLTGDLPSSKNTGAKQSPDAQQAKT